MPGDFALFPQPFSRSLNQGKQPPPYGDPPPDWPGTIPEWAIEWALTTLKEEHVYQQALRGGRMVLGGAVVDFFLPFRLIVIRVQGQHWHVELGADVQASDQLQKEELESQGLLVIDVDEKAATDNTIWITREAIAGRSHYTQLAT